MALKCSKGHKKSCEKLRLIANIDKDWKVRLIAVGKITDQNLLADIAKNDIRSSVRIAATNKITDQNLLADIAKNYTDWKVRETAVKKITDQKILTDIAKYDTHWRVRRAVVKKITAQNVLIEIAKNETDFIVRRTAIRKITDQNFLLDIYKNDTDSDVRIDALRKITDQNILLNIYKNDTDSDVRKVTFDKITDQNFLLDIVKSSRDYKKRCTALNRLNEHESYQQIIDIINKNKKYSDDHSRNLAAIGTLKIIPKDKILNKNYEVLSIDVNIYENTQKYYDQHDISQIISVGEWRSLTYEVNIKTNNFTKSFRYAGKQGGKTESQNKLHTHIGIININEICEFLLSPLRKDDLLIISNESDVYYLREVAKSMLQNKPLK